MDVDPVLLARIQFAMTVGFHFLFPPITIGLAWLLVIIEWKAPRDPDYDRLGRFFAKLFALTFAVGVATGIVMEFQFGTNWAAYSRYVGDIFGAPLAAEAVFAFFLESAFLGLYLFGRNRVSRRVHWFSILMVAIGATISAFWILVANSWQQTPAGYEFNPVTGRAELTSFYEAVFNPSMLYRFAHTMNASLIAGAFFLGGFCAALLLKNRDNQAALKGLKLALVFGFIVSLMAVFPTGDMHARQVAHDQPVKFAAMEGLYESQDHAPLVLFGYPMDLPPRLWGTIEIDGLLSLMAYGDMEERVIGIKEFRERGEPTPPLWLPFVSFHNMVILGLYFIAVTGFGLLLWRARRLTRHKWFLIALVVSIPLPLAACQLGWIVAEVGRQPWVVYNLLRVEDAVSPTVSAGEIWFSMITFGLIYLMLGALWIFLLVRETKHGLPENMEDAAA